jgi:hypothetical protein
MSAKRARLSGDFKAAPDIRQNGPTAGSGYVLRSAGKVKVRNWRSSRNTGIGFRRNPASIEGLNAHGALIDRRRRSLAANFRRVAANRRQFAASRRADETKLRVT